MIFNLQAKVAVISGGGSGIGKAIAECFALQGATVIIVDLNLKAAQQVSEAINSKNGNAHAFACDITNKQEVVNVFSTIISAHQKIDILVNSAGIAHIGKLENTTEEDFEKVISVNIKGTFNTMRAVITNMVKQGCGVILNLASIASSVGLPDRFAYSMSKGAVVGMTLSVAKDYLKQGIRCNCISPARVHTPFVDGFIKNNYHGKEEEMFEKLSKSQPIGRMAKSEEIAYLALYLCSEEAAFITGNDYPIDGGFIKLNN